MPMRTSCPRIFVVTVAIVLNVCVVRGSLHAQTGTPEPSAVPTVAPEAVRRAYMNCLLEVDRTAASLVSNQKAREEEARTQLALCENRKKDCSVKRDGADCRTFIEEFGSE